MPTTQPITQPPADHPMSAHFAVVGWEIGEFCGECKNPCDTKTITDGIGSYEHFGFRGFDSHAYFVSECCEATVYALRREYDDEGTPDHWELSKPIDPEGYD